MNCIEIVDHNEGKWRLTRIASAVIGATLARAIYGGNFTEFGGLTLHSLELFIPEKDVTHHQIGGIGLN